MNRTVIAGVVAIVIAALTAIAFFITSASFEQRQRNDADAQLGRAYQVVQQLTQLEGIDVSNKAERLAAEPAFLDAIRTTNTNQRGMLAQKGFLLFNGDDKQQSSGSKPDTIALLDTKGNILAMSDSPNIVAKQWLTESGASILPGLNYILALPEKAGGKKRRVIISDLWHNKDALMKVGIAPVIDPEAVATDKDDGVVIVGAIVVAYAQTSPEAQRDKSMLGTDIAYYDVTADGRKQVIASSFTKETGTDEDTARAQSLGAQLATIKETAERQRISINGVNYVAAAVKMPRKSTKPLPTDPTEYPQVTAGAVVLAPIMPSGNAFTVKLFILMLGIGALAIASLGLYLSHRRLMTQVDQVEQGVTDIINGNVDRTFRPVGEELDGLANGLNVMLARLLGRPEPGDEEFDDEGNPIVPGRVEFDEGDDQPAAATTDPDLAALAALSEPDYYKRVYTDYLDARKASGNPDEVSFESFIAKLKVNEGKLKAQYQCRAVRFRVVTKDNKVSLKPVPIFA
ncbi:MAG: hypothetical protein H0T79_24020 [Deltaproteobacteria bacterium]|nr:hypothetical protein [Deltaproteobacteria bacterium]